MYVQNKTSKPIGLGATIIVPDQVGELPEGFSENHPTVKYYIAKGWLAPTAEVAEPPVEPEVPDATEEPPEPPKPEPPPTPPETPEPPDVERIIAGLARANKAQLMEKCGELGIECSEEETNDALKGKIADKLRAE